MSQHCASVHKAVPRGTSPRDLSLAGVAMWGLVSAACWQGEGHRSALGPLAWKI